MKELSILGGASESFVMLYDKALLQVDGAGRYDVQCSLDGEHWSVLSPVVAKCEQHSRTIVLDLLAGALVRVVCVSGTMEAARYSFDMSETSEAARIEAEAIREANELSRVEAEASRAEEEAGRILDEGARVRSEAERVKAESARVSAESGRASAEAARVSKEAERRESETARRSAEDMRVSQENTRNSNENARKSAENARVSQENTRKNSESDRAQNEASRKKSEAERIANEAVRQEAEAARDEAFRVAEDERDAHLREVIGAFIPTGIKVDCPERITMGNLRPRGVEVEMLPEGAMKNVMYLSDNRSVMVWPDGRLEVTGKGKSVVHVVPTMNTALARSFVVDVVGPGMRMTQRKGVRLLSGGGLRLT